jgi:GntR family transcriptional regulator
LQRRPDVRDCPASSYVVRVPDFSSVSRRRDTHLYQQIAAAIEADIAAGNLKPGEPIPSEKDIMDATGASRWAVRHAIAHLREQGTLYTVAHLGSFVARPSG